jgi:hypothetical protein
MKKFQNYQWNKIRINVENIDLTECKQEKLL